MALENEFTKQALYIEDCETKLLQIAKTAVLYRWSKEKFKQEVDKEIKYLLDKLTNEELKKKAVASLRMYAQRIYAKQLEILKEHAKWLALITLAGMTGNMKAYNYERKFRKEYEDSYTDSPAMTKYATDEFERMKRQHYYKHALPLDEYHKEYMKKVAEVTSDLVEQNAKEDYSSNVSLRNIAEMTVRYEHQTKMVSDLKEQGTKLVYIVPHANCSKRCEKYQVGGSLHKSGLYSLDGTKGYTKEGVFFVPLEFATDNPIDRYVTKAGKVYQNGCITGFNCRHILEPYNPKAKPRAIPAKVIKRERAIEERQREYERSIRQCKKAYVLNKGVNNTKANIWKDRAKRLNRDYEAFSRKNKVAFYRERTALLDDDKLI